MKNYERAFNDFCRYHVLDINRYQVPDIFNSLFFLNESDKIQDQAIKALNSIGNDVCDNLDNYLYKELGLNTPTINRVHVINRITTLSDLSKSITPLVNYDRLVKEVVDLDRYDWRIMILDGVQYNNFYGRGMELLYPMLRSSLGVRHLYKDMIVKATKYSKDKADPNEKLDVVLNFIYLIRLLAKESYTRYGSYLNLTDIVLNHYLDEMFNNNFKEDIIKEYAVIKETVVTK